MIGTHFRSARPASEQSHIGTAWYRLGLVLLVAACSALLAASVHLGQREYAGIQFRSLSDVAKIERLTQGEFPLPTSMRGLRTLLAACDDTLISPFGRFQGQQVRAAIAETCQRAAAQALEATPDWSLAHYVAALTSAEIGAEARALTHLERARLAAPYESWIGRRRAELAFQLPRNTTTPAYDLMAEIQALAHSEEGRTYLAHVYLGSKEAAAQIDMARESLPTDLQLKLTRTILHTQSQTS